MTSEADIATIMIVDDTPANLDILREMLQAVGYRVLAFPRGAMALTAAVKATPDLILLDIMMPEMDGYEVCERLKADAALREIPVIFISALDETKDKVRAFVAGGVDYITKPFQVEEVHARVQTHLRIRSLQRQLRAHNENLEKLVAERTLELTKAYERLQALDTLKDDFLTMFSHEIRTPTSGVLGIGEMIIDLCPPSDECLRYTELFRESSVRLCQLINDVTFIVDMHNLPATNKPAISFPQLLETVMASLTDIKIASNQGTTLQSVFLKGDQALLQRALKTTILLATRFCRDQHLALLITTLEPGCLRLRLKLDALTLSEAAAASFFEIESKARAASPAEALGLAPIVAHKIITALGGELRLVRGEGTSGHLEALLLV